MYGCVRSQPLRCCYPLVVTVDPSSKDNGAQQAHGVGDMPTTGCAEAFTKLVAARDRLRDLTTQMKEAQAHLSENPGAGARYAALQAEYEAAFRDFKVATQKFSVTVRNLSNDGELRDYSSID